MSSPQVSSQDTSSLDTFPHTPQFSARVNRAIDEVIAATEDRTARTRRLEDDARDEADHANSGTIASTTQGPDASLEHLTFDSPDFDEIAFINQLFPTEQSLEQLDPFVAKLRRRVRMLDEEILTSVRKQSTSGAQARKDLDEAKRAIQNLFGKVRAIKAKAEQSELMVHEITKNIKSLDYGKRNLTTTIRALKRLHMLVAAVDQLKRMAKRRQYRQAAQSLEAINALRRSFEQYEDNRKIRELFDSIDHIKVTLRDQILAEFKTAWDAQEERHMSPQELLADAAAVADAMGGDMRQRLIAQYVQSIISLYRMIFGSDRNKDSALDQVQKRYNWIKRKLKQHEEQYGDVFPRHWCVPQEIVVEFCLVTRADIERLLHESRGRLDAQVLHGALMRTITFERDMHNRFRVMSEKDLDRELAQRDHDEAFADQDAGFSSDQMKSMMKTPEGIKRHFQLLVKKRELERSRRHRDELEPESEDEAESKRRHRVPSDAVQKSYNFLGFISTCFEDSMDTYVAFEDNTMREKMRMIMSRETWGLSDSGDGDGGGGYSSSQDLFIYISESMKNCTAFNRGAILFKLLEQWKKYLREYADELLAKIPKVKVTTDSSKESFIKLDLSSLMSHATGSDTVSRLDERGVTIVCYIINTADYCQDNCEAMESEVSRQLEDSYAAQVDLSEEQGRFYRVIKTCIETLVMSAMNTLEPELNKMSRTNWASYDNVGDQSAYVSTITATLADFVTVVASRIPLNHFKFLCDNFVITFFQVYMSYLFKCKRISSSGAQQLLLDLTSLTNFLKGLINVGDPHRFDEDELASFAKKVLVRTRRAETILKVVLASPEAIAETYNSLVRDGSPQELQRIFDMKGIAAKDRASLAERLESGIKSRMKNLM